MAGERDLNGVVEEVEAVGLVDGLQGGLGAVVDDKGLALGLEVFSCDDLDDVAKLGEDDVQGGLEGFLLDALFEVSHVDAVCFLLR